MKTLVRDPVLNAETLLSTPPAGDQSQSMAEYPEVHQAQPAAELGSGR
jgi:hypothetical protein